MFVKEKRCARTRLDDKIRSSYYNIYIEVYMISIKNSFSAKDYLTSIKIYGRPVLSPDEIDYLASGYSFEAYEFRQEKETDEEFLEQFMIWLHEKAVDSSFADYYLFIGLRYHETLTQEQFDLLERKVTECFENGRGWIYELNHRLRFRMNIRLIISHQRGFRRLIKREY